MMNVTSRGCSRVFIFLVLHRILAAVKEKLAASESISMPFSNLEVQNWLRKGWNDCQVDAYCHKLEKLFGGTRFSVSDSTTYWSDVSQFITWWKNNIERKSKFKMLNSDAEYVGDTQRLLQRALYCKNVIAIASSIKNHFDRVRAKNSGLVVTMPIPTSPTGDDQNPDQFVFPSQLCTYTQLNSKPVSQSYDSFLSRSETEVLDVIFSLESEVGNRTYTHQSLESTVEIERQLKLHRGEKTLITRSVQRDETNAKFEDDDYAMFVKTNVENAWLEDLSDNLISDVIPIGECCPVEKVLKEFVVESIHSSDLEPHYSPIGSPYTYFEHSLG